MNGILGNKMATYKDQRREVKILTLQLETQKKINKIQESMIKDYQDVMIPLYQGRVKRIEAIIDEALK
jgi:hypothetical protein